MASIWSFRGLTAIQAFADPMYNSMFAPPTAPLPASSAVAAAFTPQAPTYDPYGFDDDGHGSGALYSGGPVGLKNKRAEVDRECECLVPNT